jgi:hypothetical protein
MAFYAAYLPPQKAGLTEADALSRSMVLRDGFSFGAFVFTGLWLLAKRLWLPFLAFAVIYGLIALAQWRYGFHPGVGMVIQLVIGIWLGLEGANLQGRKLMDGGWRFVDVVEARNQDEAERRFFEKALARGLGEAPPPASSQAPAAASFPAARPSPASQGVIGMFPDAGAR